MRHICILVLIIFFSYFNKGAALETEGIHERESAVEENIGKTFIAF